MIPAEKRTPEAVLAAVFWNVGRVASATAWRSWYCVAVFQPFLILSLLSERPWAPYAPVSTVLVFVRTCTREGGQDNIRKVLGGREEDRKGGRLSEC